MRRPPYIYRDRDALPEGSADLEWRTTVALAWLWQQAPASIAWHGRKASPEIAMLLYQIAVMWRYFFEESGPHVLRGVTVSPGDIPGA